ncbi:hypothetical protein QC761_0101280 [Podospora bellae-mahoneyi]|uniref:Uncharacterized protein n=1 Tax=Podospora bellae-mahoneyi TaxID=2093777 RepID=A0ABR0F6Z1_9PEZI|nr:hypothetical protein QC761_0101280 [Podospora bellae-mahoneyi]
MPPLLQDSLEQGVSRLSHLLNGSHPRQELNPQGPQPRDRTSVNDRLIHSVSLASSSPLSSLADDSLSILEDIGANLSQPLLIPQSVDQVEGLLRLLLHVPSGFLVTGARLGQRANDPQLADLMGKGEQVLGGSDLLDCQYMILRGKGEIL